MRPRTRTIGRLAQETGVGVETVRFYERRGLIKQPRRPAGGGYRHYDEETVQLLRSIRIAKEAGLTLADIERLVLLCEGSHAGFCQAAHPTIAAKLAATREQIARLKAREAALEGLLAGCITSGEATCPILRDFGYARPGGGANVTVAAR